MQLGPETKSDSIGDTLRSVPDAPFELKKPIAKFASLAAMPVETQVKVLVRRNLAMARDMIAVENDGKATAAVDNFSKVMTILADFHLLPFTDSNDDVAYPVLLHPAFEAVWDLQHETPDFAQHLATPVWEQMWQLCWKQLKNCKQSLRVCYTGSGTAHGTMCECNTLSEAAFYSQELLHGMADQRLRSKMRLNPKNCCVYEIDDQLIVVFRKVHKKTSMHDRSFFCIPLSALQSRITALEANSEQDCTAYALKRFAATSRPQDRASDSLLHQFVATSVISETNLDICNIRRLKSADEKTAPYTMLLQSLLKTENNHWLDATSRLMASILSDAVVLEPHHDPSVDKFTVIRLWMRRLLKYVVPSQVYRWCMAAYKTAGSQGSDWSRRARWTTVLSGLCNMLVCGTSLCDDPTFLTWAPESYLLMPCSK